MGCLLQLNIQISLSLSLQICLKWLVLKYLQWPWNHRSYIWADCEQKKNIQVCYTVMMPHSHLQELPAGTAVLYILTRSSFTEAQEVKCLAQEPLDHIYRARGKCCSLSFTSCASLLVWTPNPTFCLPPTWHTTIKICAFLWMKTSTFFYSSSPREICLS